MYITPITFLEVSLRSSCADLHVGESLTVIRDRMRAHAPPKASASASHVPASTPTDVTRDFISATSALTTSASSHLLTSAPHHPLMSYADCWPRWLGPLTVDFYRPLTLNDRWLFSRVVFCNPGSPYPIFRVDFIFAICFCILCL